MNNEDPNVQKLAIYSLQQKSSLPAEILQLLGLKLEHEDPDVREAAIEALQRQSLLSETILKLVVERLEDEDYRVRGGARETLSSSPLPTKILLDIATRLKHPRPVVQLRAFWSLDRHTNLPGHVVQKVVEMLRHDMANIRLEAIMCLGRQTSLPTPVLQEIEAQLKDDSPQVVLSAAKVLSNRVSQEELNLPETVLQMIARYFQDGALMRGLEDILLNPSRLPDSVLMILSSTFRRFSGLRDEQYRHVLISILRQSRKLATMVFNSHDDLRGLVESLIYLSTSVHHIAWYHYENKLRLIIDDTIIDYEGKCPCSIIKMLHPDQPDYGQKLHSE